MTYPSGRTLAYSRDSTGRITQINTSTGTPQVVVENVAYHPYGGAKSWTFGNTQTYARTVDQDGRISSYTLGGVSSSVGFDTASRITGIGANTYGYDTLDRLNSATALGTTYGYTYDAVGNRLTKTVSGNTDTYTYSGTSNRIAALTPFGSPARTYVLDANGSTTSDAVNSFTYDVRGRMVSSTNASSLVTTYQVNALGQRIRKTNSNEDTVYTYDGEGRLIAENDAAGTLKREHIYLGDIPVGIVQGGALAFVHPDHLNTPRLVTNSTGQAVWRWDNNDPFGGNAPDQNPSGLGTFVLDHRFPGQVWNAETQTAYNYFRDCYDPATGRFCQSDPIGLEGGINTYSYVKDNPLRYTDSLGLVEVDPSSYLSGSGGGSGPYLKDYIRSGQQPGYVPTTEDLLVGGGIVVGGYIVASTAVTAPTMCYAVARSLGKDPCKNVIIAATVGAALCQGKLPNSLRRDLERREEIRRGAELSGQRKIGSQGQYP